MTTITDYTSLQTAVTEYLAREGDSTLIARIPTFVQLCEAKLNRDLYVRQMEQRATALIDTSSTDPEFISLPNDFLSMRRVRLSSVNGKPELRFKSNVQMDEYRYTLANQTGQPQFFTISGSEMELGPTPDANYTIEMVYRKYIPALATNSTNWLLTLAPDIYLYGTLLETAPYIKEDERAQIWGAGFTTTLDSLNELGKVSAFNAGPMQMRPSGVTP